MITTFKFDMALVSLLMAISNVSAFAPLKTIDRSISSSMQLDMAKVGIFFGTSTGSTEAVAELIAEQFGDVAAGPFDVEALEGSVKDNFENHDTLVVGAPTWNTGADTERSGTGWDEIFYGDMQELNLSGKKVAVFGLGDQVSYAENYADATGELFDVFESLGATMVGSTSQEGYEHEASKAIRGDKFCGLLCDMVNQEDQTEERVENWVAQLLSEGFFDGASSSASPVATAPALTEKSVAPEIDSQEDVIAQLEENNAALRKKLEDFSQMLDQTIETHADNGFTAHYNPKTESTMWTSSDGRTCYYSVGSAPSTSAKTSVSP